MKKRLFAALLCLALLFVLHDAALAISGFIPPQLRDDEMLRSAYTLTVDHPTPRQDTVGGYYELQNSVSGNQYDRFLLEAVAVPLDAVFTLTNVANGSTYRLLVELQVYSPTKNGFVAKIAYPNGTPRTEGKYKYDFDDYYLDQDGRFVLSYAKNDEVKPAVLYGQESISFTLPFDSFPVGSFFRVAVHTMTDYEISVPTASINTGPERVTTSACFTQYHNYISADAPVPEYSGPRPQFDEIYSVEGGTLLRGHVANGADDTQRGRWGVLISRQNRGAYIPESVSLVEYTLAPGQSGVVEVFCPTVLILDDGSCDPDVRLYTVVLNDGGDLAEFRKTAGKLYSGGEPRRTATGTDEYLGRYTGTDPFYTRFYSRLYTYEQLTDTIGPSGWAKEEVDLAREYGLITLHTGVNFKHDITRFQFAELVVNLVEKVTGTMLVPAGAGTFTDCEEEAVLKASAAGIVNGVGKGLFDPEAAINREQIAVMLARAIAYMGEVNDRSYTPIPASLEDFEDRDQVSGWAAESVGLLAANHYMNGTSASALSPKAPCTIEQAQLLIVRIYRWTI